MKSRKKPLLIIVLSVIVIICTVICNIYYNLSDIATSYILFPCIICFGMGIFINNEITEKREHAKYSKTVQAIINKTKLGLYRRINPKHQELLDIIDLKLKGQTLYENIAPIYEDVLNKKVKEPTNFTQSDYEAEAKYMIVKLIFHFRWE